MFRPASTGERREPSPESEVDNVVSIIRAFTFLDEIKLELSYMNYMIKFIYQSRVYYDEEKRKRGITLFRREMKVFSIALIFELKMFQAF